MYLHVHVCNAECLLGFQFHHSYHTRKYVILYTLKILWFLVMKKRNGYLYFTFIYRHICDVILDKYVFLNQNNRVSGIIIIIIIV